MLILLALATTHFMSSKMWWK